MTVVVISGLLVCNLNHCSRLLPPKECDKYSLHVNEKSTPSLSLWKDVAQSFSIEDGCLLNISQPLEYIKQYVIIW